MWIVCITSVRHVLTVNGYGGRQTKENEKSWCFKGWETLVTNIYELINEKHYGTMIFYVFPYSLMIPQISFGCRKGLNTQLPM